MDYKLKKINKKTTFCTMCFNLGMEEFGKMRNDSDRNNFEKYYLQSLAKLCTNFPNLIIYCDFETEDFLKQNNIIPSENIFIKAFPDFESLKRIENKEKYEKLIREVYDYYPSQKDSFSLFSLNKNKVEMQSVYTLLVQSKIDIIKEASEENPFNTDYFCWIDAGCFQQKYDKFWSGWNNEIEIDTELFKCCVNMKKYFSMSDVKRLKTEEIVLKPTETIEFIAPMFYIHKSNIFEFYEEYNRAIKKLNDFHLPCTEQAIWTYMLKTGFKKFYVIRCDDYNSVIQLVSNSKCRHRFSEKDKIEEYINKKGHKMLKQIFSVENTGEKKVIRILGCKISLKRHTHTLSAIEEDLIMKLSKVLNVPKTLDKIEVHLCDHCNLNCRGCDHFSPLAEPSFANLEEIRNDFERLAELTGGNIKKIVLLGGEPLLHENVIDFLPMSRSIFPKSNIILFTNAILLDKQPDEFWKVCRENNIQINYTKYPIKLDYKKIAELAERHSVHLKACGNETGVKTSTLYPLDYEGKQEPLYNFINCQHSGSCIFLKSGKLYPCTVAPNIEHFNKYFNKNIPLDTNDGIDIYKANNLSEILRFLYSPIPFCKYCNVKKRQTGFKFGISKKDEKEWSL